jgi:GH35 family endo-1,4-beta-xylanase
MRHKVFSLVLAGVMLCQGARLAVAVVIEAGSAAVRTEGGPMPHGGWNLWSDGRVGQPLRFAAAGVYRVVVRGWGSPAAGVWPEMALLVDGRSFKTVSVAGPDAADYRFDVELAAGAHEIAVAFLNDAIIGKEDRNLYLDRITVSPPPATAEPVLAALGDLAAAAQSRERAVVAATAAAIEKYRKADARLRIVDSAGRPVRGARVSVVQTGHDFLFGCNIYGFDNLATAAKNAAYKRRFAELFNYATVGFYWKSYEPQRGKPNYAYTDKVVQWCRERGIRMKGHPLLWGEEAGIPLWSHGQPAAEVQRQRVEDIIHRYQGRIEFWEVVNEPSHQPWPKIDGPYRWARQADPRAYLIVNDYHVLADGCPGFFRLLTAANRSGVPLDGIGIQAHEPHGMRFPLDQVEETLDHYAALGKELHITEFTPTSGSQKIIGGYGEGAWDEAAQADYAVKFYRICFAQPAVRAITWWDLSDQDAWLAGGGMLRADMSPKPVYDALTRLVHQEWTTRLAATSDTAGRISLRGFCGTYRATVEMPDGKTEQAFHLGKGPPREIVIALPASTSH